MLVYISKAFEDNIGATMHYKALKEIYGENNVFTIDLRPIEKSTKHNYICYGKYRNTFDRVTRWLQGNMMFISSGIIDDICNIIKKKNADIVFIEDSVFGNLVKAIKKKFPEVKVFSFYHDIKADLYPQWIKASKTLISRIEYGIGIHQEQLNQKYVDCNIVFNERDKEVYYANYKKYPEAALPLPAPVPSRVAVDNHDTAENAQKRLLFVGKKYYPNLVGFDWFVKHVLPKLAATIQIDVVGRGLEELRGKYNDSRINIIGGVESLEDYYINADIVIAPLFDGGGMKSKTVEALSFGKIFIGTKESLFGFWEELDDDIRNQTVFESDSPDEWIKIINQLAASSIKHFNEHEFEIFKEKFSYEAVKEQLRALMTDGGKIK